MKPTLVVTMGDPNGVGPEILLRAYAGGALRHGFIAIGDGAALRRAARALSIESVLDIEDMGLLADADLRPGQIDAKAGAAAHAYIRRATELALAGKADAIVTLPVSKEAVQLSVPGFTGHTEMIAEMCGETNYTMMLTSQKLTVTHVSTHVSMMEAVRAVTQARVLDVIRLTRRALLSPLGREPRIAVAGLNAHAGEGGLFGREEIEHIAPAVEAARAEGILSGGPHPPDTVFLRAARGDFDAVVCMYHDQGHVPLKLLDFSGGVNVTLGLRVIRTSVDHGTAFDIAYRGVADIGSFVRAFDLAAAMCGEVKA